MGSRVVQVDERAEARDKVAAGARRGEQPSEAWKAEDLAWCFAGREAELQELEEVATRRRREQNAASEKIVNGERLRSMTEQVLAEREEARRRDAETEARRRLGLDSH